MRPQIDGKPNKITCEDSTEEASTYTCCSGRQLLGLGRGDLHVRGDALRRLLVLHLSAALAPVGGGPGFPPGLDGPGKVAISTTFVPIPIISK